MSRPRRIEFPGALYHVTSRGNARQAIYLTSADRQLFLQLLAQAVTRYQWRCHAYCLMDNHYHLLLETLEPTLARGMRHLNGLYTQHFNQRHQRVGHVFQGRYKAILIEQDSYLLELCRYVVLNPVRARVVRAPDAWPWSSYLATVGDTATPSWLTTDWILAQFGTTRSAAQAAYHAFVYEGIGVTSPWESLRGQIYLGSEAFCLRFAREEPLEEIPRAQRQPIRPSLEDIFASEGDPRSHIRLAYHEYGYRLRDMAVHLGVHYTTVSRWLKRVEEQGIGADA